MGPDTALSGGYRQSDPVGTPQWAPIIDYVNSPSASVLADKQPDDAKETTEQELESLPEKVDATQAEHNRESHRNPPNLRPLKGIHYLTVFNIVFTFL